FLHPRGGSKTAVSALRPMLASRPGRRGQTMTSSTALGFSPGRLAHLERVLRERYVEAGDVPNALIQIWRRGELAHRGVFGFSDLGSGTPVAEDSIFRIYSMT